MEHKIPASPDWAAERDALYLGVNDLERAEVIRILQPRPLGSRAFLDNMDQRLHSITDPYNGSYVAYVPLELNAAPAAYTEDLSFERDFQPRIKTPASQSAGNHLEAEFRIDGWQADSENAHTARQRFNKAACSFLPDRPGRNELVHGLGQAVAKLASEWNRRTLFARFIATGTTPGEKSLHTEDPWIDYVGTFYLNNGVQPEKHIVPAKPFPPENKRFDMIEPPKQSLVVWRSSGLPNPSLYATMGTSVTGLKLMIYTKVYNRREADQARPHWLQRIKDWQKSGCITSNAPRKT